MYDLNVTLENASRTVEHFSSSSLVTFPNCNVPQSLTSLFLYGVYYHLFNILLPHFILHDVIIINEISFYSKVLVKFDTK